MRAVILAIASASLLLQDAKSLDTTDKEYPVSKVIRLLKDMSATLTKEGEQDQEIYEKLACWCETNDKDKTAAIDIAQKAITELTTTIEELTAKSQRLNGEIETLKDDIAKAQDALNKATAIRTEELASFNQEEKDMMQSIQALKNAVMVLSKHHEMPAEALVSVATVLRHHMQKKFLPAFSQKQSDAVTAFLQQPAGFQSYAPQSGQIFGILKQMKETFETNLSASQKEELAAQDEFEQMKTAKLAEIAAAKKQVETKTVELAETDEKCATAKEDLESTKDALSADEKFLLDLKEKCKQTDEEMAERTKTRNEEIAAVSEAITILNADDAHDMFSKTLGFTQKKAVLDVKKRQRRQAIQILKDAAKKSGNAELAMLAATAQLDAFTKVIAAVDEMVVAIETQKKDEIKHRDFCIADLAQNEKSTAVGTDEKGDIEAKIADLKVTIDTLKKDMETKTAEVAEMNVQAKRAGEDREAENAEFQETVADQRATQEILNKALTRLQAFYDKKAFLQAKAKQTPGAAAPPPPPGFDEYKTSSGAGGVVRMLSGIINDAKNMEREAIMAESDAQAAYESFLKNTNGSIKAAQKALVMMGEDKAKGESDLVQAESDLKSTMTELEGLSKYAAQLHQSCDFVMENFEIRQAAMDQEVEALRQAKAVLSGADFS
jgi:predicted  nucleic acid-binding Zn-ribbon protein